MGTDITHYGGSVAKQDRAVLAHLRQAAMLVQGEAALTDKRIDNGVYLAHGAIDGITGLHRHIAKVTYENPSLEADLRDIQTVAAAAISKSIYDFITNR